jgi:hypothetical protein
MRTWSERVFHPGAVDSLQDRGDHFGIEVYKLEIRKLHGYLDCLDQLATMGGLDTVFRNDQWGRSGRILCPHLLPQ